VAAPVLAAVGTTIVIVLFEGREAAERGTPRWLAVAGLASYPFYLIHSSILLAINIAFPTSPYLWRWALAAALAGTASIVLAQHFLTSVASRRWKLPSRVKRQGEAPI
jgi:peptidoglycan/LPS O-acetylase OafA/YrhL